MADIPSSSQRTNEDPTAIDSLASQAILTITPDNAEAKLAFSEVADWILEQQPTGGTEQEHDEKNPGAEARAHARKYTWVESDQRKDDDVTRHVRRIASGNLSSSSPMSSPLGSGGVVRPRPIDVNKYIWAGCYFIDLTCGPASIPRGWGVGRLRTQPPNNDFVLCLGDSNTSHRVRRRHAVFQVHRETGRIYIQKSSNGAEIEVDGESLPVGKIHVLNHPVTKVRFGQLAYCLEYARFSQTEEHAENLQGYIAKLYGTDPSSSSLLALTPTPSSGSSIRVGQWVLTSAGTVGSGGEGRVSVAVDSAGRVVALKRVSVTKQALSIALARKRRMESLTKLVESAGEHRLLRLVEVISDDVTGANPSADMWFVLEPAIGNILIDMVGPWASRSDGYVVYY